MSSLHEELKTARELITSLHGVVKVEFVCHKNQVRQVQVLTGCQPESMPDSKIADYVASILSARMHLTLDPGQILVAQAPGNGQRTETTGTRDSPRLKIEKTEEVFRDEKVEVTVELSLGGRVRETHLQGPRHGRIPLVARAALECASLFIPGASLELSHILRTQIGGRHAVLVSCTLHASGREETLLGAVFVEDSPAEAALKAALDGVNRRMGAMPCGLPDT